MVKGRHFPKIAFRFDLAIGYFTSIGHSDLSSVWLINAASFITRINKKPYKNKAVKPNIPCGTFDIWTCLDVRRDCSTAEGGLQARRTYANIFLRRFTQFL
jgi:hypothetical protein